MRGRRVGAVAAALMVAGLSACGSKAEPERAVEWGEVCDELDRQLADHVAPGMAVMNLALYYDVDLAEVSRHCDAL